MHKFKKGDIVQYIDSKYSNKAWVKANLKFKVKDVNTKTIAVESLQDISSMLGGATVPKGKVLYDIEIFKFKLVTEHKSHLPKWW